MHKRFLLNISLLIFSAVCVIQYIFLIKEVDWNLFLPNWSDEISYYLNAYRFFINSSLVSPLSNHGGSYFFAADAHGIFYPIWIGLFGKIFGWHSYNFIILNFLYLVIGCGFLYLEFRNAKLFILGLLLIFLNPFILIYCFTFMQECFHICIGLIFGVQLYKRKNGSQSLFNLCW